MTDWQEAGVRVLVGDCRERLRELPDASVDAIVTDAPYELGFMGQGWDRCGVAFDPATWAAVLRVAKPGAYLLSFGGTRTYHRMACAVEDGGWEVRDMVEWIYGSGFPKNAKVALKPAHEPICLARKPFRGSVAACIAEHGTGGLNIDGCRVATGEALGRTNHVTSAFIDSANGSRETHDRTVTVDNSSGLGRWPANLVLSHAEGCVPAGTRRVPGNGRARKAPAGAPKFPGAYADLAEHADRAYGQVGDEAVETWECVESCPVAELDRQSGERVVGKGGTNHTALGLMNDDGWRPTDVPRKFYGDQGGASRFFYVAKASTSERNAGLPPGQRNTHPTVKPLDLMCWLCRLVTPPGGVVLDPFAGSGTTLIAAQLEGFGAIGIEQDEESVRTAVARLNHWRHQPALELADEPAPVVPAAGPACVRCGATGPGLREYLSGFYCAAGCVAVPAEAP